MSYLWIAYIYIIYVLQGSFIIFEWTIVMITTMVMLLVAL